MCGIYGVWDVTGAPVSTTAVHRATTTLRHRGPDDEGYLLGITRAQRYVHCAGPDTSAALGLPRIEEFGTEHFDFALGFRRLSILDLSPRGHQPMVSPDGRHWIVFNGEIYNYRELRAELAGYGHQFSGGSDTEVILAAFQQWGSACLHRFNGMWAFAIWDTHEQALFAARDRFGVKPFHYTWNGARFAFASEIKALLGTGGVEFRPDDGALYEYLISGELPSPGAGRTFFQDVHGLPPSHCLTLQGGQLRVERYYAIPVGENNGKANADAAVTRYRDLFDDAVRIRLRSDVPVGTCLSGGIDSSSIVCTINRIMAEDGVAAEQVGDRQKTFSAVYDTAGRYNETEHIETVLRATGAERNFTVPTAEGLMTDLDRLIWHQDEPFGSTSIYAQWCVMAKVRERGVTVLLDGQGADEALGGYRPFEVHVADLMRRGEYHRAFAASRDMHTTTGLSRLSVLGRAIVRQAPARYLDRLRDLRSRRTAAVLRPAYPGVRSAARRQGRVYRGMADHLKELISETSLPHLLRHEDRNAMAFSVEGRVPFVDYRLIEHSLTAALPWCIHQGWTKWVLRSAMRDRVPAPIIWRRDKVGFETPESDWLKTLATRWPDLIHRGSKIQSYVDLPRAGVRSEQWLRDKGHTGPLWRVLNLELWLQTFSAVRSTSEPLMV